MELVIDFKREVYQRALSELARYLRRRSQRGVHRDRTLDRTELAERG
jgi:hypothetical protein